MRVYTPQGKCLIDNYSQRYLTLPIPGSRLTLQVLIPIVTVNRYKTNPQIEQNPAKIQHHEHFFT